MQEDQTVSFGPMYVHGDQRWITKLFALYLLIILIVLLVRVVTIAANLRKVRKDPKHMVSDALWSDLNSKALSFKDLSIITFLFSLLNFTWCIGDDFLAIRAEKTPDIAYVLVRAGEELVPFGLGLTFCILLYSVAMLLQAVIRRRKAASSAHNLTSKPT